MSTLDPVTASFRELPTHAQSLGDLQAWFEQHPVALIGDLHMTPDSQVSIDVLVQPDEMLSAVLARDALPVYVPVKVMSPLRPHPALFGVSARSQPRNNVYFKYVHQLELPLEEWPIATAIFVAHYIADTDEAEQSEHYADLQNKVLKLLDKHFNNVSLKTLVDIYKGGLLELDDKGRVDTEKLVAMLFATQRNQATVALPGEDISL